MEFGIHYYTARHTIGIIQQLRFGFCLGIHIIHKLIIHSLKNNKKDYNRRKLNRQAKHKTNDKKYSGTTSLEVREQNADAVLDGP